MGALLLPLGTQLGLRSGRKTHQSQNGHCQDVGLHPAYLLHANNVRDQPLCPIRKTKNEREREAIWKPGLERRDGAPSCSRTRTCFRNRAHLDRR